MAKDTSPQCKQCRRETEKLFLKGERCLTDKCAVERRSYPPGEHGRGRIKQSEYLLQLREKQKARRYYGLLEKQFRNTYEKASRRSGPTGENLLRMLETRLDNVVYRLGFAATRVEARQLVQHGHININGKRVDIPSYLLRNGDKIEIREKSRELKLIAASLAQVEKRPMMSWLELDKATFTGIVKALPVREENNAVTIKEQLIVEFYSR